MSTPGKKPAPPAAEAEEAPAAKKPRSKKKLLTMLLAAVVLVAAAGGGAWFFLKKPPPSDDDEEEVAAVAHHEEKDKHPPTFMPLDNMVVNLADGSGERFAQIGITFEVADAKSADQIKTYLPTIRSGILMLISQRTAADLLQREGKEKLAQDILAEASRPFGGGARPAKEAEHKDGKEGKDGKDKKKAKAKVAEPEGPVRGVLFSSFIIQ